MHAYNDAVLPYFNMVPYLSSLDNRVCANMYVIPNLHWIVVEVTSVSLVRGSMIHVKAMTFRRVHTRVVRTS